MCEILVGWLCLTLPMEVTSPTYLSQSWWFLVVPRCVCRIVNEFRWSLCFSGGDEMSWLVELFSSFEYLSIYSVWYGIVLVG